MTTPMRRRGEPQGLLGWPQDPLPLTPHTLRLCVKVNARGRSQLDLSHRGLTLVPHEVFQFQQLDILTLSHNKLDQLPPMISYLRGIRTLHLQHNALTSLPPTLPNCRQLTELDLGHNLLPSLPMGIGGLRALRILKLGNNQLEQVPHELGLLTNLRVLDLHGNRLWYVPFSLQNLYRLLRLDLSDNLFDQIPLVVTKLSWIHALDMSKNRLASLPPDFDQMRELRELNLSENRFVTLGVMATKLRQLKYLSLSHNRLQYLPQQVSQLKNLRVLHLTDNHLTALPDTTLPPHLKYLNTSQNHLPSLSVIRTPQLVALDASANQLESLPHGIFRLKQLTRLNLSQNRIVEVPEEIGWMKKLASLDLSENDLRSLPASLHFLEKLTSFNVRGNPQLSRTPLTSTENTHGKMDEHSKERGKPKASKQQAEKQNKKAQRRLFRQYSSMPSLHPQTSSSMVKTDLPSDLRPRPKLTSHQPGVDPDPAAAHDRTWLDNFLFSKPRRRASWDANMTPQTARSIPYPPDEFYETGEISASFSAESVNREKQKLPSMDPLPLTALSFRSDDEDSALEASFSSCDDDLTPKHHNAWVLNHQTDNGNHPPQNDNSNHKSTRANTGGRKSAAVNLEEQTLKKTPFPSVASTEKKVTDSTVPRLGIYDYRDSEGSSWQVRPMNVLLTNVSQPNSQPSTVRGRRPLVYHSPEQMTCRGGQRGGGSDMNWTMRSHLSEPLTVQTWTQTGPPEATSHHTGTRTLSPTDTETNANHPNPHAFTGLRSPDSSPMLASMGGHSQCHHHGAQSLLTSPDLQPSSLPSSSSLHPPPKSDLPVPPTTTSSRGGGVSKSADYTLLGVCSQIQTQLHRDLLQPVIRYHGHHPGRFSNKTIQPGNNGLWHWGQRPPQGAGPTPREAEPVLQEAGPTSQGAGPSGQGAERGGVEAGLEFSPGETFTTTRLGGHYVSAFCPHLQVSVPPGAVTHTLHVSLQQLTISHHVLKTIGQADSYVSNLLSVGPIIFLHALEKVTFASPVTLTLPAPVKVRGHQGHLVVVSVRADNTCVPCVTGYQSSRREVTLTTWHMTGKVAVLCKAKCKYKACKSVEQLLATLNLISRNASHLHP